MACDAETLLATAAANGYYNLDDRMLKMAILFMLCNGSGSGGGSLSGLSQGAGAPVAAPTNTAVTNIYIDTNTGVQYYWNTTTQAWT